MSRGPLMRGIPALAPGERRVINWGQYGGLRDSLPARTVDIAAKFQGRRAGPWTPSDHEVRSVLEVASFEKTDAAETPSRVRNDELKKIRSQLESIARTMGKLSRDSAGEE